MLEGPQMLLGWGRSGGERRAVARLWLPPGRIAWQCPGKWRTVMFSGLSIPTPCNTHEKIQAHVNKETHLRKFLCKYSEMPSLHETRYSRTSLPPPIHGFTFHCLSYPWLPVNHSPNIFIQWKIPEINNSYILNLMPFWAACWNLTSSAPSYLGCESSLCPASPCCIYSLSISSLDY